MGVNAVDLELLRTFQAIHHAGTLTGAARTLRISQPAVTARLQALETACGVRLFDRTARGCVPTSAGDDLARRCAAPLGELAAIAASLACPTDLRGMRLRIGAPAEYFTDVLSPRLAPVTGAGVRVEVTLGLAEDLLAGLRQGDLDLVVSTVRPPERTHAAALDDEEFLLVAAPAVAAALDPRVMRDDPAKALSSVPRVSYDEQQSIIRRWWRHVLRTRPPAAPAVTVPDLRAVRRLVLAGVGISALPTYLVAGDVREGRLVELCPTDDRPINTFFLVTLDHLRHQPHVAAGWAALRS